MTTIELKNNIIFDLLFSNKIKIEEEIDYKKFKELYAFYDFLPETYFASILGIRLKAFTNLKSGYHNATILRNFDISSLKNIVLEELYKKNLVKNNSRITYLQFLDILEQVPFLNEYSLAEILEIKLPRFKNFKNSKNLKETAKILKRFNITLEEEKIVKKLISDKIIYPGLEINYEFFKKLHSLYPYIRESRFAYILEIKSAAFCRLKKGQSKSIILKSRISSFIEEQKNNIITKLIKERGAKLKEEISYDRFLELYSGFEYIPKFEFAVNVLGISYDTYITFKYNKSNAVILKSRFSLTDQDRITIFNDIVKRFKLREGSFINKEKFFKICNYYKDYLTDIDICRVLGIEESGFYNMKYHDTDTRVYNGVTKEKIKFLRKNFLEIKFYSKKEILNNLNEYEITLTDFIIHIINNSTYTKVDDYLLAFEKNDGLFIGKKYSIVDKEFYTNSYVNFLNIAKYIVYSLKKLYYIEDKEDAIQEILIYIYYNCGDLYYNFGNSRTFFIKVLARCKKYILGRLVDKIRNYDKIRDSFFSTTYSKISTSDTLEEAINLLEISDNNIYEIILNLVESGISINECFQKIEQINGISENIEYQKVKNKILNFKKVAC